MEREAVRVGMRVRTSSNLDLANNMSVSPQQRENRRANITGTVIQNITGEGNHAWWVSHEEDQSLGPYYANELELV